jgi:hypothetical protein
MREEGQQKDSDSPITYMRNEWMASLGLSAAEMRREDQSAASCRGEKGEKFRFDLAAPPHSTGEGERKVCVPRWDAPCRCSKGQTA